MKPATPGFTLIFLSIHPSFSSSATDIQLLLLLLGNNCNYYLRWKRGEKVTNIELKTSNRKTKTKPEQVTPSSPSVPSRIEDNQDLGVSGGGEVGVERWGWGEPQGQRFENRDAESSRVPREDQEARWGPGR